MQTFYTKIYAIFLYKNLCKFSIQKFRQIFYTKILSNVSKTIFFHTFFNKNFYTFSKIKNFGKLLKIKIFAKCLKSKFLQIVQYQNFYKLFKIKIFANCSKP